MSSWIWISVVGASIVLNGFFAGMETGITSARRVRLVHWARRGRRGATIAAGLVQRRENSVVAAVVGNNVAVVTGTALATAWAVSALGSNGELIAALAMAGLNIVFGEILPKAVFRADPESKVVSGAALFRALSLLLWPLEVAVKAAARLILFLLGQRDDGGADRLTRAHLLQLFSLSREQQKLGARENRLLSDFIAHSHRRVEDVMRPWERVSRVSIHASVREVLAQVRQTGHSRLPVQRDDGSLDGLILYSDLQDLAPDDPILDRIRDFSRIPDWMALDEAIAVLTDRQVTLGVVTGVGPAPIGIVTLEDLLEPFVGEILDEHDNPDIPNATAEITY